MTKRTRPRRASSRRATPKKKAAAKKPFRLQPMPVSKATNAYELLDEVKALVLEEPARIYMWTWIRSYRERAAAKHGPACGSVGCVAGWMAMLRNVPVALSEVYETNIRPLSPSAPPSVFEWASDLYNGIGSITDDVFLSVMGHGTYGTEAYAQSVVKTIEAYQARHRVALQARALPPVVRR